MNIQNLVRDVVHKHRLTQDQLGKLVGKSQSWACRAINGQVKRIDVDVFNKLNTALNQDVLPS
ncbi:Uncharacterised protein [Neisseria animaloris]|uniref:helix-turn-helix domain-containing protein n=1 Tax=Neisseria animaloris TaxID=326522 RepID=UPI000A18CE57|nr:helix-turn-helix domain-containing protein [Neisseria animaloris]OSI06810.1 hypothetical protein BWD08_10635 [Neisseria animaloris]VEH86544.1 Uncharacterised protein [Neisseria animaloris]